VGVSRGFISAALLFLAGCQTRVVSYDSFLTGLPGSEQQLPGGRKMGDYIDPTRVREDQLVKNEPGTEKKKLVAKSGRHLMIHIYNTIDAGDVDLFTQQVLSTKSKNEFAEKGVDPREGFDFLKAHQEDLQILFSLMPAGENTPGLRMMPMGGGVQRVALDGIMAKGLYWNGFDMIQERGNWKLRWMVGPQRYER